MLKYIKRVKKMKNDSLKINQNKDGSFSVEWDKQDPNWKWLNNMTTKEIEAFIKESIQNDKGGYLK